MLGSRRLALNGLSEARLLLIKGVVHVVGIQVSIQPIHGKNRRMLPLLLFLGKLDFLRPAHLLAENRLNKCNSKSLPQALHGLIYFRATLVNRSADLGLVSQVDVLESLKLRGLSVLNENVRTHLVVHLEQANALNCVLSGCMQPH